MSGVVSPVRAFISWTVRKSLQMNPARGQHRRSAARGQAAAAARRVRLHRRRRRRRSHAARELPRLRRRHASGRAAPSPPRRATSGRRSSARALALPFLLAPVGSSRMFYPRGEEVAARAAGAAGHGLHPVDASRAAGSKTSSAASTRAGLVSALSRRRPRRRAAPHRARARRPATPRSSSPSTRRSPACASAMSATASRSSSPAAAGRCCRSSRSSSPRPRWLAGFLRRRRPDDVSQRRAARTGRCRTPTSAPRSSSRWSAGHDLALDSRRLEGPDRHQGRAYRRRRAARGRRGRGRRSSSRITAAGSSTACRRRSRAARRSSRRSRPDRGPARRRHPPRQRHRRRRCASARAPSSSAARTRYGLGAAGGAGVTRAIEILRADLVRTMKLLGCPSVTDLNPSYLDRPAMKIAECESATDRVSPSRTGAPPRSSPPGFASSLLIGQEQEPQRPPTFRTGTNVIRVDATVTDRNGTPLTTLTADDFEIQEDGKLAADHVVQVHLGQRPAERRSIAGDSKPVTRGRRSGA